MILYGWMVWILGNEGKRNIRVKKQMDIRNYIVEENISVLDTMKQINAGSKGIAFVCRGTKLHGVVTDGDIRRYILSNGDLVRPVSEIAHRMPVYLPESEESRADEMMRRYSITAVPITDSAGEIIKICFWREDETDVVEPRRSLNLPLVIMAGGKGSRLKPYTDIIPKPLIPVGDKTITEHIMDRFAEYDCRQVLMIVNYKKDFIKAYYADSEAPRNIRFVEEHEYMGTGGGLKLVKDYVNGTFFMSNCDILVNADYNAMLEYHRVSGNLITLICAERQFVIPYGSIKTGESGQVEGLEEKPELVYKINTGLYLIEPEFLERIPDNTFIHITDVIEKCVREGEKVGTFMIKDDDWMDMGQMDEYEKMRVKIGV